MSDNRTYNGQMILYRHSPGEPWRTMDRERINMSYTNTRVVMDRAERAMAGTHWRDVLGFKSEFDARAMVWC